MDLFESIESSECEFQRTVRLDYNSSSNHSNGSKSLKSKALLTSFLPLAKNLHIRIVMQKIF